MAYTPNFWATGRGHEAEPREDQRDVADHLVADPRVDASRPGSQRYWPTRIASIDRAIERGEYRDCSDVAQRLGYTKARISLMMNLTLIAPSIQEEVLSLESIDGLEPMGEHAIRAVSEERDWAAQRARWDSMVATHQCPFHLSR